MGVCLPNIFYVVEGVAKNYHTIRGGAWNSSDVIVQVLTVQYSLSGDPPPVHADHRFAATYSDLVDMLTGQLEVCDKEEHTLRVLMEQEIKEKIHDRRTKG